MKMKHNKTRTKSFLHFQPATDTEGKRNRRECAFISEIHEEYDAHRQKRCSVIIRNALSVVFRFYRFILSVPAACFQ